MTNDELHMEVGEDKPVLGDIVGGQDHASYPSLKAAFMDPEVIVELLSDAQTDQVIGYTFSIPMVQFNPEWVNPEGQSAAYIYATIVQKEHQGKRLVRHLVDPLFKDMKSGGYTMAVRDAKVENGYAASIDRRFAGEGIILKTYEHDKFGMGLQKYYEIDINAYLHKIDLLEK